MKKNQRVLIMTAVEAEREAVRRGIGTAPNIEVHLAGVGPASAAARTAALLAKASYDLVISAGIAGGFPGIANMGSIVVANTIIAADLGAETAEGFISVDKLGFGSSRAVTERNWVERYVNTLNAAGHDAIAGDILTLSTVTGTAATAAELLEREPDAAAEAMEGFGVATAAREFGIAFQEIRTISNAIGPRDRSSWRLKEALTALEAASSSLVEVL